MKSLTVGNRLLTELSTLSTDYELKHICYISIHKNKKMLSKRNITARIKRKKTRFGKMGVNVQKSEKTEYIKKMTNGKESKKVMHKWLG